MTEDGKVDGGASALFGKSMNATRPSTSSITSSMAN